MAYPKKKRGPSSQALKRFNRVKANASAVGEIIAYKPAGFRVDGSPLLRDGEVYVTQWGLKYHPSWCEAIASKWDKSPKGLFVTRLIDVGGRQECGLCGTPLTSSAAPEQPRKTSTEGLDREREARDARLAAGERRRNGG